MELSTQRKRLRSDDRPATAVLPASLNLENSKPDGDQKAAEKEGTHQRWKPALPCLPGAASYCAPRTPSPHERPRTPSSLADLFPVSPTTAVSPWFPSLALETESLNELST